MFKAAPIPSVFPTRHAASRERMADAVVEGILTFARVMAVPAAGVDAVLRRERTERVRAGFSRAHKGRTNGTEELRSIWFARLAREGLRLLDAAGFGRAVLRRVVVVGEAGWLSGPCVLAIYHSPWGRVLARWLSLQSHAVLFATGRWADRAPNAQLPCSWRGIRTLVAHVRAGGYAAVTCDHFGDNMHAVTVSLLGREVRVSSGAARMAAAASVPLVPVTIRYREGRLEIRLGDQIACAKGRTDQATREIVLHLDAELRTDPSSWADVHRYLARD